MSEGRGGVQIFCFFFLKKKIGGAFTFGSFSKRTFRVSLKRQILINKYYYS